MPWQDAESKALGNQDIEVNTDRLNIRSSANAGRGGNAQATGIEDSNIDFTGNQANVNAFARTRDGDAEAVGLDASSLDTCLLYTSPSPRDATLSRMPASA